MRPRINKEAGSVRRAKPKKGFTKFLKGKVKTFNAHVNEFEDDTANSKVVRLLIVVLLLHLIFIGGVSLHGFLVDKRNNTVAEVPTSTIPVPTAKQGTPLAVAGQQESISSTVSSRDDLIPAPIGTEAESLGQPQSLVNLEPVATSTAKPGTARHLYATGDSWETIARDNDCTVADLKAVNPGIKLASGVTLVIPALEGEDDIPLAEPDAETMGGQVYVIKKGDTLSKVAREYKVSVDKLQKHNNITDPRKIRIGQEIKIPAK